MQKIILGALAAVMTTGLFTATAADAAPQRQQTTVVRERPNGTVVTRTTTRYRTWAPGQRFDRRQAQNYRVITDWRGYRLAAPPHGHQYVRSGRDIVLIRNNGQVVRVFSRRF